MHLIHSKFSLLALICLLFFSQPQMVNALETSDICVDIPYDYTYLDDRLSVAIKRYEEQNLVYFVADIQVQDASVMQAALSGDKPYGRARAYQRSLSAIKRFWPSMQTTTAVINMA
ncbi:MAG: hypothetical protein GX096_09330 [Clostridiales bacterium]|nr:hypothetical protein [Clostridiales bacterium]